MTANKFREREPPVKLGAKYNGKNPQGRPIGHTTETATKNKILIACNPDFSTAPPCFLAKARTGASLEMTEREIRLH